MLERGRPIRVRKLRPDGSQAYAWTGVVLQHDAEGIVLEAQFNVPFRDLGYTTFRQGDIFIEFYYWDRWYNVFQISDPERQLKGWYANLGQPATLDQTDQMAVLSYVDLALDVWMRPDGSFLVLDEDELQALSANPSFADALAGATEGRQQLLTLAQERGFPSWPPPVG